MKGIGSIGLWGILMFFFDQKKRKKRSTTYRPQHTYQASRTSQSNTFDHNLARKKRDNIERMKKIAALYTDHSAEVIPFFVRGKRRVETLRLLDPGNKVELRLNNGNIKVFAYGEYIAELLPDKGSHLEEVMNKGLTYHAYLGGRDLAYMLDEDLDSCSIIVFYKLPGLPPTKVNIE